MKLKVAKRVRLFQLDTAIFAFAPFLNRLQEMRNIPLGEEILHWESGDIKGPSFQPVGIIENLKWRKQKDLQTLLGTSKSIKLNESQSKSLLASISQRISLVQGPPGGFLITCFVHIY